MPLIRDKETGDEINITQEELDEACRKVMAMSCQEFQEACHKAGIRNQTPMTWRPSWR